MRVRTFLCFVAVVATATAQEQSVPAPGARLKVRTVHSPRPEYPESLRAQHKGGVGIYLLHVDPKTGVVKSVDIVKSTGVAQLDENSVRAFRQWRYRPPIFAKIKIPTTFDPSVAVPLIWQPH